MRVFLTLLVAPLLLAPVRYQSGQDSILLAPTQGLASNSYALPAAVSLGSPTVITLSPTVVEVSPSVSATAVTPTVVQQVIVVVKPELLMPSATAIICNRALQTVAELSILSYQQQRQQGTMNLTIASTIAAAEAAERRYPLLTSSQESLKELEDGTPQAREITTAMGMAQVVCKPAPGARR